MKREERQVVRDALERSILQIATASGTVTADDVRRRVVIPDGLDPRIVGTAFLALMLDGWIVEIGDLHTIRSVAHARKIRVWRLSCDPKRVTARLAEPALQLETKPAQRGLFDGMDEE